VRPDDVGVRATTWTYSGQSLEEPDSEIAIWASDTSGKRETSISALDLS